jgi:hypothetical protein
VFEFSVIIHYLLLFSCKNTLVFFLMRIIEVLALYDVYHVVSWDHSNHYTLLIHNREGMMVSFFIFKSFLMFYTDSTPLTTFTFLHIM